MIAANILAILIHLILGMYALRRHVRFTVLFGYVFFVQCWSVVSCFYNDLGIYNFELFRNTETTLATSRLVLFYLVFNLGFLLVARWVQDRPLVRRDYLAPRRPLELGWIKLSGYVLVAVFLGYVIYSFATEGIPILQGMHRLLFLEETGPVERWIVGHSFLIAFLLGYFRRKRRGLSYSGLLLLVLMVYLLAIGNKFSAFIRVLVPYYAAVFVVYLRNNPHFTIFNWRLVSTLVAIVVVALGLAYGSYLFWGQEVEGSTAGLLTQRIIALQGHLWWATDYNLTVLNQFDPHHWQDELQAILHPDRIVEGSVGMKYVMIQAIGAERAFPIFDIGYLYTMAYPAILVLTLPYPIALLVQLLAGMALGGVLHYFHYSVAYRHTFRALAGMWIILPFLDVLFNGNLYVLFAPLNGVAFRPLYIFLIEIILVGVGRAEARRASNMTSEPVHPLETP